MKVEGKGLFLHIDGAPGYFPEEFVKLAIEKQTLKKPEHEDGPWSLCPRCGNRVCNDSYEAVNHITTYCERCGQALDWSDIE